jgi:hypothetical protein
MESSSKDADQSKTDGENPSKPGVAAATTDGVDQQKRQQKGPRKWTKEEDDDLWASVAKFCESYAAQHAERLAIYAKCPGDNDGHVLVTKKDLEDLQRLKQQNQKCFFEVCGLLTNRVEKDEKMTWFDLHKRCIDLKLPIYIIPAPLIDGRPCKLRGAIMPYRANVVLSLTLEFYQAELKRFGRNNEQDTLPLLKQAGTLTLTAAQGARAKSDGYLNFPGDMYFP